MALINVTYPVTGGFGNYQNAFPSQRRLPFTCDRQDSLISSVSSGAGGVVQIASSEALTDIIIGDYVSWGTDAYSARSSRVTAVIGPNTIEVDEVFTSVVVTNSFLNFKKDWTLEVRYILKDSTSNDQSAPLLLKFNTQVPSAINGSVNANIGAPADLLNPDFEIATGVNLGLFVEYKIQYRESWKDSREEEWISPDPDIKIMLVHGTKDVDQNEYTDKGVTKRFVKGYPTLYSYIHTDVNDQGVNNVRFNLTQYDISKVVISTTEIYSEAGVNGVYTIYVDPSTVDDTCVFLEFSTVSTTGNYQYDGDQYDGDQYEAQSGGLEFPYTFPYNLS